MNDNNDSGTRTDDTERKYLLNCRNCAWHTYVNGSMIHADYERDCHENSIRTALAIGPYCPKGSVVIRSVHTGTEQAGNQISCPYCPFRHLKTDNLCELTGRYLPMDTEQ